MTSASLTAATSSRNMTFLHTERATIDRQHGDVIDVRLDGEREEASAELVEPDEAVPEGIGEALQAIVDALAGAFDQAVRVADQERAPLDLGVGLSERAVPADTE